MTTKEHHDIVVDNIANNVASVYAEHIADNIQVVAGIEGHNGFDYRLVFDSEKQHDITPNALQVIVQNVIDNNCPQSFDIIHIDN